jgi:2-phosphosulfolactate phosphatase
VLVTDRASYNPPRIQILDFVEGARRARGLTVVIDVFRAFSLAAHLFARGAARIVPVGDVETARALKARWPNALLIGERHARPLPGFDAGNSPTELERFDVAGRTLIHTTHAGTQGLTNAVGATEVITGALVNAAAIVRYIRARGPSVVSLVRMGHEAQERCDEDDLCASLLEARLLDRPFEVDPRSALRAASSAAKFFDPGCPWAPQGDFDRCTQLDAFDFILRLEADDSLPSLQCISVPRASP